MPTVTQEVYDIPSINTVRINPSIVEGSNLYTSILGPDKAVTIVRYAPTFITDPVLTGDPAIPSTLTCSAGVVDASPAATRFYQWFINGVEDIGGEGSAFSTFVTDISMDGVEITCEVTATNFLGTDSVLTNGITVTRVEDVNVWHYDTYTIGGLPAQDAVTVYVEEFGVVTGMWLDDFVTIMGKSIYTITGIENEDHAVVNHVDTYVSNFYTFFADLTITNPGAEDGVTGWTNTAGTLTSVAGSQPPGVTGTNCFRGPVSNTATTAYNDVTIPSDYHDEVDAEELWITMSFWAIQAGGTNFADTMRGYYVLLDDTDTIIDTHDFFGYFQGSEDGWEFFVSPLKPVLPNTRKVRVIFDITAQGSSGNRCQFDAVALQLFQAS